MFQEGLESMISPAGVSRQQEITFPTQNSITHTDKTAPIDQNFGSRCPENGVPYILDQYQTTTPHIPSNI